MAVVADALVGEKALSAQEWLSQSAIRELLVVSSSSANKSAGEVEQRERANDGTLRLSKNSDTSRQGSVDVELQAWEVGGIPLLKSAISPLIRRKSSKSSSNKKREHGIREVTSSSSPLIYLTSSKSSSGEKREDGIPPLTSTCSPLIKSKSSKSSSNQDSLPGLVVAPDGVTLVKDRRKCKPRGILTVAMEMSSFDSSDDNREEEEVALPIPSPSVATVEWVDESWAQILSPPESRADEFHLSCPSINSKSRIVPTFDFPVDSTTELSLKESSSVIGGAEQLRLTFVPSVQELCDVRDAGEGCPADLFFAGSFVSCRPELADEVLLSDRDCPVSTSSNKQHCRLGSNQVMSPQEETASCELDDHLSESQSLDIRLNLDLERQTGVSDAPDNEVGEMRCDFSSDTIPDERSEIILSSVAQDEIICGNHEDGSTGIECLGFSSNCPIPLQPLDYISNTISPEQYETISLASEKEWNPLAKPERESRAIETVRSSGWSGSPLDPQCDGAGDASVPQCSFTDVAYARDVHIVNHSYCEECEFQQSELPQRLSPQVLVAETLYQLAAENLRKTRTEVKRLNSSGEKRSCSEGVSSLSIVKLHDSSSIDKYTSGENAASTEAAPLVLTSMVSRHITSRPDQAKEGFTQPLQRITLTQENDLSQELQTVNPVIRILLAAAHDEVQALPATTVEAQDTDESSLVLSRKGQRQYRQLSSGYTDSTNVSAFRRATRHRLSSCSKRVGWGRFLAAAAALAFVAISLATGSCHLCYASNHGNQYIRPT